MQIKDRVDLRYSINLEYCGYREQRHVVRFLGNYVSNHETAACATSAAIAHNSERLDCMGLEDD